MPLNINTREVAHVSVLDVHGRIVLGDEIGDLRDAVHGLLESGKKKIILNLADVDYIDSSGVGELVGCYTTVRNAGGELKLQFVGRGMHLKFRHPAYPTPIITSPIQEIRDNVPLPALELGAREQGAHS